MAPLTRLRGRSRLGAAKARRCAPTSPQGEVVDAAFRRAAHFHMHRFAHAQNDLVKGHSLAGHDNRSMADANKKQAGEG